MSQYLEALHKQLHDNTSLPNDCIGLIINIVKDDNDPIQFVANCKEILKQYDSLLQRIIKEYPRSQSFSPQNIDNIMIFGQLTILKHTLDSSFSKLFKTYDEFSSYEDPPSRCEIRYYIREKIRLSRLHKNIHPFCIVIQDVIKSKLSMRKIHLTLIHGTDTLMRTYMDQLYGEIISPLVCVIKKKNENKFGYKTLITRDPRGEDGCFIRNTINSYKINNIGYCCNIVIREILIGIYRETIMKSLLDYDD